MRGWIDIGRGESEFEWSIYTCNWQVVHFISPWWRMNKRTTYPTIKPAFGDSMSLSMMMVIRLVYAALWDPCCSLVSDESLRATPCLPRLRQTVHYGKSWRHPLNRKYVTYRNAIKAAQSHGHKKEAWQIWRSLDMRFRRYVLTNYIWFTFPCATLYIDRGIALTWYRSTNCGKIFLTDMHRSAFHNLLPSIS